jgi:hypothetical protein
MSSGSDFTWDWIVESCQQQIEVLSQFIGQDSKRNYQTQENYRRGFEALILAVEQLREHPQLASNVPMKSLATLRWFPQKNYEVQVYYHVSKLQYQVSIYKRSSNNQPDLDSTIEQTLVYLSKLSNIVALFIEKTKQPSSDRTLC